MIWWLDKYTFQLATWFVHSRIPLQELIFWEISNIESTKKMNACLGRCCQNKCWIKYQLVTWLSIIVTTPGRNLKQNASRTDAVRQYQNGIGGLQCRSVHVEQQVNLRGPPGGCHEEECSESCDQHTLNTGVSEVWTQGWIYSIPSCRPPLAHRPARIEQNIATVRKELQVGD